jgi:hypothetical protein
MKVKHPLNVGKKARGYDAGEPVDCYSRKQPFAGHLSATIHNTIERSGTHHLRPQAVNPPYVTEIRTMVERMNNGNPLYRDMPTQQKVARLNRYVFANGLDGRFSFSANSAGKVSFVEANEASRARQYA